MEVPWSATTLMGRMVTQRNVFCRPVLIGRGLVFIHVRARYGMLEEHSKSLRGLVSFDNQILCGDSNGDTPVPIPNTEVKPVCADGTWGETPWESRSPPVS